MRLGGFLAGVLLALLLTLLGLIFLGACASLSRSDHRASTVVRLVPTVTPDGHLWELWWTCCDCGLTHLFVMRELESGELSIDVIRDEQTTEKTRRVKAGLMRPPVEDR